MKNKMKLILCFCGLLIIFDIFGLVVFNNMRLELELLNTKKKITEEKNKQLVKHIDSLNKEISSLNSEIAELEQEELKTIFEYAGYLYNVDPVLLEAICLLESGRFTSDLYKTKNNAWGAVSENGFMSFYNSEQSIVELARTIRTYYLNKGYYSIEDIGHKYCPENEEHWVKCVTELYSEIQTR